MNLVKKSVFAEHHVMRHDESSAPTFYLLASGFFFLFFRLTLLFPKCHDFDQMSSGICGVYCFGDTQMPALCRVELADVPSLVDNSLLSRLSASIVHISLFQEIYFTSIVTDAGGRPSAVASITAVPGT